MEERNYGIDALRMFSMFLVVVLHVLGQGGILYSGLMEWQGATYYTAWTLETLAYCAVNCYAMISGFVMYGRKCSAGKLLQTWIPVFFWSVLLSIVVWEMYPAALLTQNVTKRAFFPIYHSQYWYMTGYFFLYLFMPVLLTAMEHLSFRTYTGVVVCTFFFASILTTYRATDPFITVSGYSTLWLVICFLWGGYLRKFRLVERARAWWGGVLYAVCVAAVVLYKYITENFFLEIAMKGSTWLSYTSPFIVLAAVGLLILFFKMQIPRFGKRIIKLFAPAALGVYLIHTHSLVFEFIIKDFAKPIATLAPPLLALSVIGIAIGIYLACTALDLVRIYLFRLIRIPQLCKLLDTCIATHIGYLEERYQRKLAARERDVSEAEAVETETSVMSEAESTVEKAEADALPETEAQNVCTETH